MKKPNHPTQATIIPAALGYYLLETEYGWDGSGASLRRTPILAWQVITMHCEDCGGQEDHYHSFPLPVTVNSSPVDTQYSAVQQPDGTCVDVVADTTYNSVGDLLTAWRAQMEEEDDKEKSQQAATGSSKRPTRQ